MSIDAYEQTSTCAFDIIGIALVTLEMIYNTLLINALRFWFAIRELLDNLATGKHSMPVWSFTLRSLNCVFTILADSWSLKGITTTTGQRLLNVFYIISSVTSAMLVMPDTPVDMCSYASMDFSFLVRCFLPPCELSDSSQNESPSSQYGENFFTFTRLVPESCQATSVGGKRSNHFLIADQSSFWRWDSIKRLLVARTFNRVV